MIIVLKPHPTPEVVQHVLERIEALGLTPHLSQGVARTIIGVIGDEEKLQVQPLQAIPGVEQVVPTSKLSGKETAGGGSAGGRSGGRHHLTRNRGNRIANFQGGPPSVQLLDADVAELVPPCAVGKLGATLHESFLRTAVLKYVS